MIFAICVMDVLSIIKLNDTQLYIIIILDKYNVQRTHFSNKIESFNRRPIFKQALMHLLAFKRLIMLIMLKRTFVYV